MMAQDLSPDAIEAIYAEDGPPMSLLITLDSDTLDAPIRASSDPDGTTSRGEDYPHFPFGFAFGGAGPDEPARGAKLEIANSDARIMRSIRALPAGAQVSCSAELVLTDSPDDVELGMNAARVQDVELDDPKVTANIQPKSFDDEPANQARYIGARTPGLV